jgi:6-phosphogluconolactonase
MQSRIIGNAPSVRALLGATLLLGAMLFASSGRAQAEEGAVFTSTNSATANAVVSFKRSENGSLTYANTYATGGKGTGSGIGTAGAVILSPRHKLLFVINAGSNDISVFAVYGDALKLIDRVSSGGATPFSLTMHENLLYVVNGGAPTNITGFTIGGDGHLTPIPNSTQPLSQAVVKPGQIKFTPSGDALVVTEQNTNNIDVFPVDQNGVADAAIIEPSLGVQPFGFDFDWAGRLFVSEAANSSASSYHVSPYGTLPISGPILNGQAAACWLLTSEEGRYAWTANAGADNISAYQIARNGGLSLISENSGVAAALPTGSHPLDMAHDAEGHFYVLEANPGTIAALLIQRNGTLTPINTSTGTGSLLIGTGLAAY